MTTQEIINTINSLPTGYTERTEAKATAKIQETAEKIANLMTEKGLVISKGSSSPSTTRSYARIYLEYPGSSHNSNHRAYNNVVAQWEWQTKNKQWFSPITAKAICEFCDSLVRKVEAA